MSTTNIFNTTEKVPGYVWWAITIELRGFCSIQQYKKVKAIHKAFPKYFPWEAKYNQVSKEVHDAFELECYPERVQQRIEAEKILSGETEMKYGPGIWGQMQDSTLMEPVKIEFSMEDLLKTFTDMAEQQRKAQLARIKRSKEVKRIWDKHYKSFGLECREPEFFRNPYL